MSDVPGIVVVAGKDRAAVVDALNAERRRLDTLLDLRAGCDEFEGVDLETVARAVDAVGTPDLFGGDRLVVLRDAVTEETLPLLTAYAAAPAERSVLLVLWVRSGRQSKAASAFEKAVAGAGKFVAVEPPPDRESDLARYVASKASERHMRLDHGVAEYVGAHVGADAGAIARVLDKLDAACAGGRVTMAVVSSLVSTPAHKKAWDLTDAVDGGDVAAALVALRGLDMHPLQVQTLLANHVRKLMKAMDAEPRSPKDLEQALGVKGFPAKKLFGTVRSIQRARLVGALRVVAEADADMRGKSGLEAGALVEMTLVRLCLQFRRRQRVA